jgi:hypothetical protein
MKQKHLYIWIILSMFILSTNSLAFLEECKITTSAGKVTIVCPSNILPYGEEKKKLHIFGTDYVLGETKQTVFLQLLDSGQPVNNASCVLNVYNSTFPRNRIINNAPMVFLEDGVYFLDTAINQVGVFPLTVKCLFTLGEINKFADRFTVITGTSVGILNDTFVQDGVYQVLETDGRRLIAEYNFTNIILTRNLISTEVIFIGMLSGGTADISLFNFSSNSFVTLPNAIPSTSVPISVTNLISNITNFISNNTVRLRFSISNAPRDGAELQIDLLKLRFRVPTEEFINDIRGAGEIHITNTPLIISKAFSSEEERFISNHDFCLDNTTLRKELTIEKCVGSPAFECFNITRIEDRVCNFGCDVSSNKCIPSPTERWIIVIGIIAFISIVIYLVYRWYLVRF